jgi:serine/threonine protein kinase
MPFSAGDKLGHYEVLSLLGQGGMGEVYRARDTTLKRDVALKVLPVAFVRDVERMARFQREAEVLASLDHPNIGHIHGLVVFEDSRGLVLALIDGPTLADRIKAGPLPLDEAIATSKQIIEALEYAHDRGVVHRDLKPANIKITPDGVVKVLDFGLAKVLEDEPASSSPSLMNSPTMTMGHTRAGVILGTAPYMSPEQAIGRTVDRRSDIFSFGAVLYEMLSGKLAFPGATTPDVLEAVVKNDPDWSALPSSTPAYLRRLLERTLVKDRKTRLQAIGEARIALQEASDEPVLQTTKATRKSRILWPILTAASLAIAAGVLAWTYLRPVPVPEVTRFEIHAPQGTTLPLGTPAVSPDGRTIAFVASDTQQVRRLYVRQLDSVDARVLPGTEGAVHPFFSPDGRSLGFVATGNKLTRVDLAGGVPRTLADVGGPWHGSWSQTGTILFTASGVRQISANGGPPAPALAGSSHPYFLPDGKRFLARSGS